MDSSQGQEDGSFDMEQFLECQIDENLPPPTPEPEDDVEMVNPDISLEIDQILMEQSEKIAYTDGKEMNTNEKAVGDSKMKITDGKCIEIKAGAGVNSPGESSPSSNNPSSQGQQNITKPKRKKKKSRNGSIYVGVGNRIEWMNLQTKFGFENVAYFATFVNATMKLLFEDFTKHCEQLKENRKEIVGHKWISGLPVPYTKDGLLNQKTESPEIKEERELVKSEVITHLKNMGFEVEEKDRDQDQDETQKLPLKVIEIETAEDKKEENEKYEINSQGGSQEKASRIELQEELDFHGPLSICQVVQDEDQMDMEQSPNLQQINQNNSTSSGVKSKPKPTKKKTKKPKKVKDPTIPVIPKKRGPRGGKGKKENITSNEQPAAPISPKEKLNLKTIKKSRPKTSKAKKSRLPKNFINFDTSSFLFPTNDNNNNNIN